MQKEVACPYIQDPTAAEKKGLLLNLSPAQYLYFEKMRITGPRVNAFAVEVTMTSLFFSNFPSNSFLFLPETASTS